ncbi:hypothetical protein [Methylobacterium nigriterrae]|uniref:hypothetical protein n=1 Tax=Methylobacterium nigriterrae TaxID=3127512 RepID=UPI0030136019
MSPGLGRLASSLIALTLCAAGPAGAQTLARDLAYTGGPGPAYGYGFADAAVSGAYIGAPLTRFPSPREIVPPAWGYGTYGVPTISGVQRAPIGEPTVYVIDSPAARPRKPGKARILSRDASGRWSQLDSGPAYAGGARVIPVTVPRR